MNPNGPQPTNPDGPAPYGGSGGWIGTALQVGGSVYDTYQRHRDVKSEQAARKAEAELAYQRSVEMWHMQNAYNTPEQQMARFGAAGLNSQLIYGQGSSGLAGSPPQYQPPNIQMAGMHPPYGGAVQSLLPTLMSVGTWMQNMRLSEQQIQSKGLDQTRTQQVIDYLMDYNPRQLQAMDNKLSMYPYQMSMQREGAQKAQIGIADLLEEHNYKWGRPLTGLEFGEYTGGYKGGGSKEQQLNIQRQDFLKRLADARLATNKADWSDYGITDPQNMAGMLIRAVTGLAGRMMSTGPVNQKTREIGKGQRGRWSLPKSRGFRVR